MDREAALGCVLRQLPPLGIILPREIPEMPIGRAEGVKHSATLFRNGVAAGP